ncbi:tRNA(Met) cytidine acetyltransferase TmcA [Halomonas shantousis]
MSSLDFLDPLRQRLGERRHRALIWLSGAPHACHARAQAFWRAAVWQSPLWVSAGQGPEGIASLPPAKARTRLGQEHGLIVIDAVSPHTGFDPDAFGALSGTLCAGGVLILMTPESWQDGEPALDADYARLAHWPHSPESLSSRYLSRLARCLQGSSAVIHWPAMHERPSATALEGVLGGSRIVSSPTVVNDSDCLSHDQALAVEQLVRLRRRRPLVLSADRGRGKSAALGIAAARRLLAGETRLWVTAPRPAAVEPLFERLIALLPQGRRVGNVFRIETRAGNGEVRFLAPDAVEAALREADIDPKARPTLFVDEAAAIPTPLLGRWLEAFPRIAFATTVHGYEGTGRGFQLRFRERLERQTPSWRALQLQQPIRWAEADPLETITRELLLLDAEPDDMATASAAMMSHPVAYRLLEREALADDEKGLRDVFGLLVQAHYRTTPADLRQLLDGPDIQVLGAYADEVCVGVCLVQREGGFPQALAEQIHTGKRRPRGHLLAQSLAAHGGWREAAERRWYRIVRIAVHPAARRRGIGAAMLERLAAQGREAGIEQLGVSFGAEPELIAFWRAQGFVALRLGLTREASSGEHALMMGRPLSRDAERFLRMLSGDFSQLLPSLLAHDLASLDADVALALLAEGAVPRVDEVLLARIQWFASGGGELALVRPWMARAWLAWWRGPHGHEESELTRLAAPLFQGEDRPLDERRGRGDGLDAYGRKARLAHWRELAGCLHRRLQS